MNKNCLGLCRGLKKKWKVSSKFLIEINLEQKENFNWSPVTWPELARDTEFLLRKKDLWDFPGGPVAKTLCSQGWGPGLITGQGIQSHILQLKTLCAAAKTQGSQIN